jgi:hypothetical protein
MLNVKLAKRACVPLSLGERGGVRETVMAACCFMLRGGKTP